MNPTYRLAPGDLVHVAIPRAHRGHRRGVKARIVAYDRYTGTLGQHLGVTVTYTSTTGEAYARDRRERGEVETVPLARVTPRDVPRDGPGYRVQFTQYGRDIAPFVVHTHPPVDRR